MHSLKNSLILIVTIAALCSCSGKPQEEAPDTNPIVSITGGKIQGVLNDSTHIISYKGIPYAAPPLGQLRWKKPQPVIPWDTVMIADRFAAASYQPGHTNPEDFYTKEFYWMGDPQFSEDCLYLNVWAPAEAVRGERKNMPVAMWIHGGAYIGGWGHEVTMDGEKWAEKGVILVTINYRLGALGFFAHPLLSAESPEKISGNYGMWDQAAALKWIYKNIAQFGGDPHNITILGQSAGAASVKNLVTSPCTKDMVKQAIIQSGGGLAEMPGGTLAEAEANGKKMMDELGCTTLVQMRSIDPRTLNEQFFKLIDEKKAKLMYNPIIDNVLLNETFYEAALNKRIADIPYMIGWNANDGHSMGESSLRFADKRNADSKQPIYVYNFTRNLPGDDSGAFHSAELWYTFGTLDKSWRPFTPEDRKLSERMITYWTNFAKYGNPKSDLNGSEWLPYTQANKFIMKFDVEP